MQINDINTLERAISTYGVDSQVEVTIEEMSELIQALLKYKRAMRQSLFFAWDYEIIKRNISEETADVLIMLEQIMMIFDNKSQVEDYIDGKVKRLKMRLDNK